MGKKIAASGLAAILGLAGFVLILVAICTNFWLVAPSNSNSGLWQVCNGDCENIKIGSNRKYQSYEMVRGFGVLGVAMSFVGFFTTLISMIFKATKIDASIMATLYLMAAFFVLICLSLFTSLTISSTASPGWGYSFGLGWAAFPLTLIAGGIMAALELSTSSSN